MRELPFTKMHGIGNDFVVADFVTEASEFRSPYTEDELQQAAVFLCDRKFGIGADGLVLTLPGVDGSDFVMRMFNPDGSEAEMCGNAIRCIAKFVYEHEYTSKTTITVGTLGGLKTLDLKLAADGSVAQVTVDMGKPGLDRADLPMTGPAGRAIAESVEVAGRTLSITGVSMGNPHAIYFESPVTEESINTVGPLLEKHALFPRRINVHSVEIISPDEIRMLTWERGAGRTLACGTGACACAVATHLNGLTGRRVLVHLAGGDLLIEWEENGPVYMTGSATEVFSAKIALP